MRVHVRVPRARPPEGAEAIVLVHGVGVSSRYLAPLAVRLGSRFRVLAPDLPGFGESARPVNVLTLMELADVLPALLDAEGIERAHFFGNSVGCQVLVELALRHPSRIAKLVLQGPTVDRSRRNWPQQLAYWILAGAHERFSLGEVLLRDYAQAGLKRCIRTFDDALAQPLDEKLPQVEHPTLVVRGRLDPIVTAEWAEHVARLLPNGRCVVVEGAHALNYSAPEALCAAMVPFLLEAPRPEEARPGGSS